MTLFNRTLSIALGAGIALTPVFAFANDNEASTSHELPPVQQFIKRIENMGGAQFHASTSVRVENSEMYPLHKQEEGSTTEKHKENEMMKHASSTAAHLEDKATAGIDGRLNALAKLTDRLEGAKKLPDGVKTSLTATLAAQIQQLTELKAKIGTDTSTSSLRDDAGKIRPQFRTYALMLPKTAITAGSERVLAIATQMDAIGVKLNTRITAASSTVNVASAQSAYTDYVAKVADAKVQANAAAALVVNLTPDNGDKTLFASNSAALKAAAADLKTAQADLKAARADIATILKAIKGTEVKAHVEASSTTQVR